MASSRGGRAATRWLAAVTLWLATGATARAEFLSIPAEYEALNRPRPELVVVGPFFTIEGEKIRGARFTVDGAWYQHQCSSEDRNSDGKTCGDPTSIDPGAHVLEVVLCTRPDCTAFGKAWRSELRFSVGLRERVTIDLGVLARAKEGHEAEAVSRKQLGGRAQSGCAAAVEQAFYPNTCTAEGIKDLKARLVSLRDTCRATWSKDTDLLFELAFWQATHQHPKRCYKASEVKKLPPFLVEWSVSEGFWPPGTIKDRASSWQWARAMDEGSLFDKYEGEALRKQAFALIDRWYERQLVVDQLIRAALDPAKHLQPLVDAAAAAKWSLNPSTPAGHRAFALSKLAGSDKRFGENPKLKALLAKGGAGDDKIHCAFQPEVKGLMRSYLSDKQLSPVEWKAIQGFVRRTPPEERLDACEPAFWIDVKGAISLEERLSFLAERDCSTERSEKLRGEKISRLLEPRGNAAPKPLRLKLMRRHGDCVHF